MYCPKCGEYLEEGTRFCPRCGNTIRPLRASESVEKNSTATDQNFQNAKGVVCPKCRSHRCEIQVQQNVTGSGSNYNCLNGGCGYLLTGPLGLLCGLCGTGSSIRTTHQSMWVCRECGNQFLPRDAAVKNVIKFGGWIGLIWGMGGLLLFTMVGAALVEQDAEMGISAVFTAAMATGLYFLVKNGIDRTAQDQGYTSLKEFLTPDEYSKYKRRRLIGIWIIPALLIVIAILEAF